MILPAAYWGVGKGHVPCHPYTQHGPARNEPVAHRPQPGLSEAKKKGCGVPAGVSNVETQASCFDPGICILTLGPGHSGARELRFRLLLLSVSPPSFVV